MAFWRFSEPIWRFQELPVAQMAPNSLFLGALRPNRSGNTALILAHFALCASVMLSEPE